jgi:hypothetical protein
MSSVEPMKASHPAEPEGLRPTPTADLETRSSIRPLVRSKRPLARRHRDVMLTVSLACARAGPLTSYQTVTG